jgi:Holliday junction resolvase RusA-like endonuclease
MNPPRRHDVTRIEFTVRGEPKAQPRTDGRIARRRKGRIVPAYVHMYTPETAEGWRERVTIAARQAGMPMEPWTGPVSVTIDLYFPRREKQLGPEYPDGPFLHTEKPDRDNCEKAILDTLKKARLFKDDAQVCAGPVRKWWAAKGAAPGARIVAELLSHDARQMTLQDAREGDRP